MSDKPMETVAVKDPPRELVRKERIPPREPEGKAEWRVTVRHSPLRINSLVVEARGRKEAWEKFLAEAESKSTIEDFKSEGKLDGPKRFAAARQWIADARRDVPDGVEVIGAEYARKRVDALRVKGTVTKEQIGFDELASA